MSEQAWGPAIGLRAHRKAAGLTQAQLARAVGLDFTYVSKIERGRCDPSRGTAARVLAAIGRPDLPLPAPVDLPDGWVAAPVESLARIARVVKIVAGWETTPDRYDYAYAEHAVDALTDDDYRLLGMG